MFHAVMVCVLSKDKTSGPDLLEQASLPDCQKADCQIYRVKYAWVPAAYTPRFHFAQDIKITNCYNAEKTNKYRNGYL